jgi:hypothetical protein
VDAPPSQRLEFHLKLAKAFDPAAAVDWDDPDVWMDPSFPNVLFQPGPEDEISYPAMIYEVDGDWVHRADNGPYAMFDRYQVTFVRHDPDSPVLRRLSAIQHSSFSRHFATSGLNHDVYVIYHQ